MRIETTSLVSFSQKGSMVALGTKSKILDTNFSPGSKLQIMDLDSKEVIFSKDVPARFNRLDWGYYGDKLFIAGGLDSGHVTMWEATGLLEKKAPRELIFSNAAKCDDDILGIDFSLGMPVLATGSSAGKILMWNLRTLDKPLSPGTTTKYNGISCLQWNKKIPQVLAVGTTDGVVSVLDLRGKNEASRIAGPYFSRSEITSLQWDPSANTQIAVSSSSSECKDVVLYDLRVTRGAPRLVGHTDGILKCSWSEHDPSLIVTCGCDGTIMAWNAKTQKQRGVMVKDTAFDFAFSPEYPDMIGYSSFNGEVIIDTLTSLNARSPFLDSVPTWQKPKGGLCWMDSGLLVINKENKIELRTWEDPQDKESYEWKILSAHEKEHSRKEILKLLNSPEEKSPIIEETEEESTSAQTTKVKIDEKDAITEKLIHGDFSSAFKLALEENAMLAALIALSEGPEVLKREKARILRAPNASSSFLLLISILSGDYIQLMDNNVHWETLVKLVGRHCSEEEFIPKVHQIAESLEKTDKESAKLCYLISKDIQKYQTIEEKKVVQPKSLFESSQFHMEFSNVFAVTEKALDLMNQKISIEKPTVEYLKHLLEEGEKERVFKFLSNLTDESRKKTEEELDLPSVISAAQSFRENPMHATRTGGIGMGPRPGMSQMNVKASGTPFVGGHNSMPQNSAGYPPYASMPHTSGQGPNAVSPRMPVPPRSGFNPQAQASQMGAGMNSTAYRGQPSGPFPTPMAHTGPGLNAPHPGQGLNALHSGQHLGMSRPGTPQQPSASMPQTPQSIQTPGGQKISFAKPQTPVNPINTLKPAAAPQAPPRMGAMPMQPPSGPSLYRPGASLSTPEMQASLNKTPNLFVPSSMPPRMGAPAPKAPLQMPTITPKVIPPPPHPPMQPPRQPQMSMSPQSSTHSTPLMPQPGLRPNTASRMAAPEYKTPQYTQTQGHMPNNPYNNSYMMPPSHTVPEIVVTPEMDATYQRFSRLVAVLIDIIHTKKGSLKAWLLKTINPKVEVLNKQISERKWSPEFVKQIDGLLDKIESYGIYTNPDLVLSPEALDDIRRCGDQIVATRPLNTGIDIWMTAIYSLLKVALH
ncbi:protein transport protein SEC31 [Nematocida sp. AWRm80]|nr:protein transport protein SEC31 [Nematocida sp. AWRm80]